MLMAWCFSTRASVATVLTTHPCVSRCLRVKCLFGMIFIQWPHVKQSCSFSTESKAMRKGLSRDIISTWAWQYLSLLAITNCGYGWTWWHSNKILGFTYYPWPVLVFWVLSFSASLHVPMCVCARVHQPQDCPQENASPVKARTTKLGQKMQNTLVKISINFGVHCP